jgi:ABC-type bacteriocin/lantibiotic exporter with double-glycine peptidase domain
MLTVAAIGYCSQGDSIQTNANTASCGETCIKVICRLEGKNYHAPKGANGADDDTRDRQQNVSSVQSVVNRLCSHGLPSRAVRGEISNLRQLSRPCVVLVDLVNEREAGHFIVVLAGSNEGEVRVLDLLKSESPETLSANDFAARWSGVAIIQDEPDQSWSSIVTLIGVVLGTSLVLMAWPKLFIARPHLGDVK